MRVWFVCCLYLCEVCACSHAEPEKDVRCPALSLSYSFATVSFIAGAPSCWASPLSHWVFLREQWAQIQCDLVLFILLPSSSTSSPGLVSTYQHTCLPEKEWSISLPSHFLYSSSVGKKILVYIFHCIFTEIWLYVLRSYIIRHCIHCFVNAALYLVHNTLI